MSFALSFSWSALCVGSLGPLIVACCQVLRGFSPSWATRQLRIPIDRVIRVRRHARRIDGTRSSRRTVAAEKPLDRIHSVRVVCPWTCTREWYRATARQKRSHGTSIGTRRITVLTECPRAASWRRSVPDPSGIIGGFLIATTFLSMWIFNTVTTVMMFAVGISMIDVVKSRASDADQG